MLTIRQNFLETIRGGKPDRFVNQYEFLDLIAPVDPLSKAYAMATPGGGPTKTRFGAMFLFPEGMPGPMPLHDEENTVVKDITKWRDSLNIPSLDFKESEWDDYTAVAAAVNREEKFAAMMVAPGLFENTHHQMGLDKALVAFYTNPKEMKEMINFYADFEIEYSKMMIQHAKPDALFHHDDWGSQRSSFISPEMFKEFYLDAYKRVYGFYKDNGIEVIVHHSDSYAANLVPFMIEMGIDVYQGAISENNVPELVKTYGGQISFMGDLNNGVLDKASSTPEFIRKEVERACRNNGKHYFIPCLTMGGPMSTYPGVYEEVTKAIDDVSKEMFD